MRRNEQPSKEKGGAPQGVHRSVSQEEVERFVEGLSDEEIILLDALLSSPG